MKVKIGYLLAAVLAGQTIIVPVYASSVTFPAQPATTLSTLSAPPKRTTESTVTALAPASGLPELPGPTPATVAAGSIEPEITPLPRPDESDELNANFVQTTYYSCVTRGTYSHCGWHIPILDASDGWKLGDGWSVALRAGVVAGVVGGLMAFG
jgi:hypothetical protein